MKTKFVDFQYKEKESSIRFPNSIEYWKKKGKIGKNVILYTHDDMDGIFSAIAMKEYLISHGFSINGIGIVNYTDGWNVFSLDPKYINVCVDYAEDHPNLDLYIDHHMDDENDYKLSEMSIKMKSDSCYGLVSYLLGMPTDRLILSVISMIDAAKYDDYNVDIKTIMNFNLKDILKQKDPRLVFAGAFNQLIKRSDYRTLIEVIYNGNLSIYKIFQLFKIFYPLNNLDVKRGTDEESVRNRILSGENPQNIPGFKAIPEFVPDSTASLDKVKNRIIGTYDKPIINNLDDFKNLFWSYAENKFKFDGFVVIKNLVYIPNGTWANALRARALIESVLKDKDKKIQFILLDYGYSLQLASYKNIAETKNLPILSNGQRLDDLNVYTKYLLNVVLARQFGFDYTGAKAGGHPGIGNLSNIAGKVRKGPFEGIKYMDIMKNYIIRDVTGIDWEIDLIWNKNEPEKREIRRKVINQKLFMSPQIRKVNI